ncbi:MAG: F0F1 ATP synthase subunit A [Epsilonproteobacteria bacterium]|nr:F0F1 ATP synthase subunit A [Campylobacterota bacterium]
MEAPTFLDFIPLPHYIAFTWLIIIGLITVSLIVRSSLKILPGHLQNVFEAVVEGIYKFFEDILGKDEIAKHFPLIATLSLFILAANLTELIPYFDPPTGKLDTTLSMTLIVFVYYQYLGIRRHGFGYIKHFTGPIWWLTPYFMPLEIIGHFARVLSLSVRLFGNIFGDDLLLAVFFMLFPYIIPIPIMFLVIFSALLQAFIFALLTALYIADAVGEPSHE